MAQRHGQVHRAAGKIRRTYVKRAIPEDQHPDFIEYARELASAMRCAVFADQVSVLLFLQSSVSSSLFANTPSQGHLSPPQARRNPPTPRRAHHGEHRQDRAHVLQTDRWHPAGFGAVCAAVLVLLWGSGEEEDAGFEGGWGECECLFFRRGSSCTPAFTRELP